MTETLKQGMNYNRRNGKRKDEKQDPARGRKPQALQMKGCVCRKRRASMGLILNPRPSLLLLLLLLRPPPPPPSVWV